jgi:hypothetical protein
MFQILKQLRLTLDQQSQERGMVARAFDCIVEPTCRDGGEHWTLASARRDLRRVKQQMSKARVFNHVTTPIASSAATAQARPYQVEAPRVSDAIGGALRDVYSDDPGLPEDLAALLRRLNRYDAPVAH